MLQYVAVCCNVLQCVAEHCSMLQSVCVAACSVFMVFLRLPIKGPRATFCFCSALQSVVGRGSVWHSVAQCCNMLQCNMLQCCAASCVLLVLQCVAGCRRLRSILQCVAQCCSSIARTRGVISQTCTCRSRGVANAVPSALQCVAVCCSVLQCVEVCCSVL